MEKTFRGIEDIDFDSITYMDERLFILTCLLIKLTVVVRVVLVELEQVETQNDLFYRVPYTIVVHSQNTVPNMAF